MAVITTSTRNALKNSQLRPLNILRDLPAVANLIEKCFEGTIDAEGRRYIQDMRRAGSDNSFLRWATRAVETVSLPLSGFVWEDAGEIIGNISIIPFHTWKKKIFLIANVAVRPEKRKHGVGRALTLAGIQLARQKHASEIWLHVRDDNPIAIHLYQKMGFDIQARRTTWQSKTAGATPPPITGNLDLKSTRQGWKKHEFWFNNLYPDMLSWYQPFPWKSARPGLLPAFYRFFLDNEVNYWSLRMENLPLGAIMWEASRGNKGKLWVAVPPEGAETALNYLLSHVRRKVPPNQTLSLDFPAGKYVKTIETAGFQSQRTLLWMKLEGRKFVI